MTPDDIKLHLEELYSYARPRILGQIELNKVLTDTFSKALQAGIDGSGNGKHDLAWLTGILRKQITVHYRQKYQSETAISKARSSAADTLKVEFDIPEKLSGLDTTLLGKSHNQAFWDAFNECIGMLSEVHADVFILRDLEDISVEEVCGIFGLRRSDVLDLIYRARMTVIACLVKDLAPEE